MNYLLRKCVIGLILLTSCQGNSTNTISQTNSITEAIKGFNCDGLTFNDSPSGTELTVSVRPTGKFAFLIEVQNVSARKVFAPFNGDEKTDGGFINGFVAHILEHRDKHGTFVSDSDGDYAPEMNIISPGSKIQFKIYENRKGRYRLGFRYLVNEDIVIYLADPRCQNPSRQVSDQIIKSYALTYSSEFKI